MAIYEGSETTDKMMKPFKHRSVVLLSTVILMRKLFKYKLTWLGIDSLNVKLLVTEMVFQLSPCSCNANCQATVVVAHCLYLSDL